MNQKGNDIPVRRTIPKARLWASCVLQGIIALFLAIGAINNIMKTETAVSNSKVLGYAESSLVPLAIFLLISIVLYIIPRTSVLGAILLTAWFGGAIATHIIHGDSFAILLMPIFFSIAAWLVIWLRDTSLQLIIPVKR